MRARVLKSTGKNYKLYSNGKIFSATLRGKLRLENSSHTNPVVVGDIAILEKKINGIYIIRDIEKRKNYLLRKSTNLSKQTQILAANIDIVFLIITIKQPITTLLFIDRFLCSAQAYRIEVVLVFNKSDIILSNEDKTCHRSWKSLYSNIGYTCIDTNYMGVGIEELKNVMKYKVSMFAGHSGVGKSTLLNCIESDFGVKTADISSFHKTGRHTTTFAQMYILSFGGFVIDSPGIKGFGVVDMKKEEIGDYFIEIFKTKFKCKFHNCLHIQEPDCAVRKAVFNNKISKSRYNNYLKIIEEDTVLPYR